MTETINRTARSRGKSILNRDAREREAVKHYERVGAALSAAKGASGGGQRGRNFKKECDHKRAWTNAAIAYHKGIRTCIPRALNGQPNSTVRDTAGFERALIEVVADIEPMLRRFEKRGGQVPYSVWTALADPSIVTFAASGEKRKRERKIRALADGGTDIADIAARMKMRVTEVRAVIAVDSRTANA